MRAIYLRLIGLLLAGGCVLVSAASSGPAPPQPPQPQTQSFHLAIQAREILRRRCSECHNDTPQSRAGLNVLDHIELLNHDRKLVLPMFPGRSRLLELIEDGSMPQNAKARVPEAERQVLRAWIRAGAPPFYPTHSESYALARVLDDVRQLGPTVRPYIRYLSLHHLLTDRESHDALDTYRAALKHMVQLLAKPGWAGESVLKDDIEPTHTLFRLDLRALGWDKPILTGSKDGGPWQRAQLNSFDLLLLDYPYAVLPPASGDYAALGSEFLEQAPQVRPVPYVRGDWLLSAVRSLPGKPTAGEPALERARQLFEKPLDFAAAQSELEGLRPPEELPEVFAQELRRIFALPEFKKLAPLADGGGTMPPRADWEREFAALVARLGLGTPVLPLDSRTWADYSSEPSFHLNVTVQDAKTEKPKATFALKEKLRIVVESKKDVYVEVIWADAKGREHIVPRAGKFVTLVKAKQPVFFPPKEPAFTVEPPLSKDGFKDRITVLAYDAQLLAGEKDFPAGEEFKKGEDAARVVHPFYAGWYDPKVPRKPDPARVIKKTKEFEIVE